MRKVSMANVRAGMKTKKPILGFLGQVLINDDVVLSERHIYYLKQLGVAAIYVHDERLEDVEVEDLISADVRSVSRALVAKVMKDLDGSSPAGKGLMIREKDILNTVSRIVEELIENPAVLVQLDDIRARDGYVFAHSVNCCVLSTLIAAKMGYEAKTLKILATGALLHDVGLIAVPQLILRKPGPLDSKEYEAVKVHPRIGYEIFKNTKLFAERSGEIILQHHERSEGQGYPAGIRGKKIASLARIVAVADVYDALTSEKTYRQAHPIHRAMEMMIAWGGEYFDLDPLNVFLESVSPYPVGTHVLLSNGESGLVIKNSPGFAFRPVVRVLYKAGLISHPGPYDLDLRDTLNITIAGTAEDMGGSVN